MILQQKTHLKTSATLAINQVARTLRAQGKDISHFGFGQSPFPVPDILVKKLAEHAHQKDYLPVAGMPELRNAIASHMADLVVAPFRAENIFVGPGSKQLIYLVQMLIQGPLLIPSPSWVTYAPQANILNKETIWIPTDPGSWKLEAATLDHFLNRHLINNGLLILNYPNNPTGQTHTNKELKDIASVCRQRNIVVLADEIYGLLDFKKEYKSIANFYPEGTIISSGLSKWCGAGGWRFGYVALPESLFPILESMTAIASEMWSCVSAPIQYAAVHAYIHDENLNYYRNRVIDILKKVADWCYRHLEDIGVILPPCQGGFYFFIDFKNHTDRLHQKDIWDAHSLCDRLLQEIGVAMLPGTVFGRPDNEFTARLSFVDFDGGPLLKMDPNTINENNFMEYFPNIANGMHRLKDWLGR